MSIRGNKLVSCSTGKTIRTYKSHAAAVRANRAKWARKSKPKGRAK